MNFFHHVLIHDNRQKTQQADQRDQTLKTWQQVLVQGYVSGRMVLAISSNETKLEGALANYVVKGGQTLALYMPGRFLRNPCYGFNPVQASAIMRSIAWRGSIFEATL